MNALSQNTKITVSDINTLISECNGKLNLSGGNMSGAINLIDNTVTGEVSEYTWSSVPIQFYDKNQKRIGYLQCGYQVDGNNIIRIETHNTIDKEMYFQLNSNGNATLSGNIMCENGLVDARTFKAGFVFGSTSSRSCILWNDGNHTMISISASDNRYIEDKRVCQIDNASGYANFIKVNSIISSAGTGNPALKYEDTNGTHGGQVWVFHPTTSGYPGGILLRSIKSDGHSGGELTVDNNYTVRTNSEIASNCGGYSQFRAVQGDYGFMIRNDGSNTWFLLTNAGDQYGAWQNTYGHPMYINNESNEVYMPKGAYLGNGKIWIA